MEELDEETIAKIYHLSELRLGYLLDLFYSVMDKKKPRQLDQLNDWFGNLVIEVRDSDGQTKEEPKYKDDDRIISVVRYHDYLYSGGNNRVTHITGKLIGTTSSNLDKERKTGELIQKQIARKLAEEVGVLPNWEEHITKILSECEEEKRRKFHLELYEYVLMTTYRYHEKEDYERDTELYPFDEEIFYQIIDNAFFQLLEMTFKGLVHAFMWLLLGCLLRNACGRICRTFHKSFAPIYRAMSENGSILDKLYYLIAPEDYEEIYVGEDDGSKYPDTHWFCDQCNAYLNDQRGFDDHLSHWKCIKCGYVNSLEDSEIYDNVEDYENGITRSQREEYTETETSEEEET